MKNIVTFLNESTTDGSIEVETTLYNFIDWYFTGTDEDTLESSDGLYLLNDEDDDFSTFETYDKWFEYFEKHSKDKIKVTFRPSYGGGSLAVFSLLDTDLKLGWDCVDNPTRAKNKLEEMNKQ